MTASAADADDIVQEAFLRLLRTPPPARDEEQWRRFVYKTAGNLIVDRWRRKKRQEGKAAGPSAASVRPPDAGDDVARTFAELSARDRALLWLAYVEGESHEEIAGSLGVGRTSVKVLLFRAKRRLRDLLTAKGLVTRTS